MWLSRRRFLGALAASAASAPRTTFAADRLTAAPLRRAAEYLWRQQGDDGGWHSPQYGVLRSGQAMTPYVLHALLSVPASVAPRPDGSVKRAMEFMRQRIDEHGALGNADRDIVEYPVYSTSYALQCAMEVGSPLANDMPTAKMAEFLAGAQFQEANGFEPTAGAYGGWGLDAPSKPGVSGHMDLAHTRRALEALAAFRAWSADGAAAIDWAALEKRAQEFLALLQKRPETADRRTPVAVEGAVTRVISTTPPFDGGFFFSPVVLAANKGRIEWEPAPHWRSYATATCDGLLALMAAGVPRDDERVTDAVAWIERHGDVDFPQGVPQEHPEPWGEAIRFYHYSVRAEAYRKIRFSAAERARLAAAVARRQREDGSFVNVDSPLMKEDDPLLCTAQATVALANCV